MSGPFLFRWAVAAAVGTVAGYFAWLVSAVLVQGLTGTLGAPDPAPVARVVADVVSHGLAGVVFVVAVAAVAPAGRARHLVALLLFIAVLALLVIFGMLSIPSGSQLPGAVAALAGAALAAAALGRRRPA